MLEHLIPISKKHSIGSVSATIFLPQNILKVDSLFNKLNAEEEISQKYPRRNITHLQTIDIDSLQNRLKNTKDVNGFLFESFDERGRLKNILRLVNDKTKASVTFETKRYTTWDNFLSDFLRDVDILSKNYPFYISAISLSYIDDFTWVGNDKIPVREIFNEESELINNKFLNSDNATMVLHSQSMSETEEGYEMDYEEKAEISFSNRIKKIIINHQYAKQFDNLEYSVEAIENKLMTRYFQKAHDVNKDVLKGILREEVLKLINLIN